MMMKLPVEETKSPRVHLLEESMENSFQESTQRSVSIRLGLHFTVRVKRSGLLSEEGGAVTRTARRPARCP